MTPEPTYRREIEALHDFFVQWYAGELQEEAFDRLERALAPGFEMVTPDGARLGRDAVLEGIRGDRGRDESGAFDVEIRNVEVRERFDDGALVRYEEHQTTETAETGRVSTVLFGEDDDAPLGVVWLDVHETWLER